MISDLGEDIGEMICDKNGVPFLIQKSQILSKTQEVRVTLFTGSVFLFSIDYLLGLCNIKKQRNRFFTSINEKQKELFDFLINEIINENYSEFINNNETLH